MDFKILQKAAYKVKKEEGLRLKPYQCTSGKLSIGYGRNLDDTGISEIEASYLLHQDLSRCYHDLLTLIPQFDQLSDSRKIALLDMRYQLGFDGIKRFYQMIEAIIAEDFYEAATELLDSRYARQAPERAARNANLIRGLL